MDRLWEVLAPGGFGGTKLVVIHALTLSSISYSFLNILYQLILKVVMTGTYKSTIFCLESLSSMAQWLGLQKVQNSLLCTVAVFFVRRKIAIKFSL